MPRFEGDLTQVSAFFHMFPKGAYEFKLGEAKAFERTKENGDISAGLRFPITCEAVHDGDQNSAGKKQMLTLYVHSEGAFGYSKQIAMAVLGYNNKKEQEFNEEYQGADFTIDTSPDSPYVGEFWRKLENGRVVIMMDQKPNPNNPDEMQQDFSSFIPVGDV